MRRGKRGRGTAGKASVFESLNRGGKVYVGIISNAKQPTPLPIIRQTIKPDSIVYTDSYDALDIFEFHHVWINHSDSFTEEGNHINGIENFWNQTKRHLRRYNGFPRQHFHLFLKACEWRFSHRPHQQPLPSLDGLGQTGSTVTLSRPDQN